MAEIERKGKVIAIVTGASSGIGREFVRILVREKVEEIWAIARNEKKLAALKSQLGNKVRCISLDLTKRESVESLKYLLEQEQPKVRYLVNNAGFDRFGLYSDISMEDSMSMIDLNCSAVVAVGLVCIPYMRKGSHIINMASQASFQPMPFQAVYGASKAFVRSYSRALHVELRDKGISVTAVCPGWVDTPLITESEIGAANTIHNFAGMIKAAPVAQQALRDAKRGKDMSICGMHTKMAHVAAKVLPQKTVVDVWTRMQRKK